MTSQRFQSDCASCTKCYIVRITRVIQLQVLMCHLTAKMSRQPTIYMLTVFPSSPSYSVLCVRFIFCYICSLRYAQGRNGRLEAPLTRARRDSRHKYLAQLLLALWQGEPNNSKPTGNNGARNEETRCNWGSKGHLSEAQGFRALKNTTTVCTLEITLCKSIIMAIDNTIS